MTEIAELTLEQISALIYEVMIANGCDDANAAALADIMSRAERDGSHSHGLFRVPGYVKALRSGKVDGKAKPVVTKGRPPSFTLMGGAVLPHWHRLLGYPSLPRPQLNRVAALYSQGFIISPRSGRRPNIWRIVVSSALPARPICRWLRQPDRRPRCLAPTPFPLPGHVRERRRSAMTWQRLPWRWATCRLRRVMAGAFHRERVSMPMASQALTRQPSPRVSCCPSAATRASAIAMMVELLAAGLTGEQFSFEGRKMTMVMAARRVAARW